MPKKNKTSKAKLTSEEHSAIMRRKLILAIELRVLVTIVVLAIYFVFGFRMIDVSLKRLLIILSFVPLLALVEWLLLPIKRARAFMLYSHYLLDIVFVSAVIHLLQPSDRLYYLPLYLLVVTGGTIVVSARFGYILAGLSSLSLSLCYALLSLSSQAVCPYDNPFGLLIINSSFFFLIVAIIQASLSVKQRS